MKESSSSWLLPFTAGIITAYSVHLLKSLVVNHETKTSSATSCTSSKSIPRQAPSSSSSSPVVMDAASLDQRILRKAEGALRSRTSRLIVVVERATNDHNYSAILRSVEALGVQHVYIIDPQAMQQTLRADEEDISNTNSKDMIQDQSLFRPSGQKVQRASTEEKVSRAQHHVFAQRALEWISVREFATTADCIKALRQEGYDIWSTDLSQEAICLTKEVLEEEFRQIHSSNETSSSNNSTNIIPDKLAVVFGTEAVGCTAEILNASDKRVYLPLRGFADSLNLSVSTALIIHQLFLLDPTLIGAMEESERLELRKKWYMKLASQRITTKGDKARRRRLQGAIREYQELEWRYQKETAQKQKPKSGEEVVHPLTQGQIKKVNELPSLRAQLKEMEDKLEEKSYQAVKDLIHNPPDPITDMRRADEHRTSYVSKTIKSKYGNLWEGMPATTNYKTATLQTGTAAFFRDRLSNDGSDTATGPEGESN